MGERGEEADEEEEEEEGGEETDRSRGGGGSKGRKNKPAEENAIRWRYIFVMAFQSLLRWGCGM